MVKAKGTIWIMALLVFAGVGGTAQAAMKQDHQCLPMHHSRDADANFIRDMIPHHQMAVDMAEKELKNGKDAKAREMAQKIIDAQNKEIADMRAWLKERQ